MLVSWKLFSQTLVERNAYNNPVFVRETKHPPLWHDLARHTTLRPSVATGLTVGGSLVFVVVLLAVNNLLFLLVPPLVALATMTGVTLGPIVAKERVKHSWELLLTIPGGVELVLIGKVGGALWWLRRLIFAMATILIAVSAGVGFISLTLIPTGQARAAQLPAVALCGVMVALPVTASVLFLIDRTQQYLLMMSAALAASTSSASVPGAVSSASIAAAAVWVTEVIATAIVLIVQPGGAEVLHKTNALALVTLGPTVSYILEMPVEQAALYTLGTFVVRELAVFSLWRFSLRNATRHLIEPDVRARSALQKSS